MMTATCNHRPVDSGREVWDAMRGHPTERHVFTFTLGEKSWTAEIDDHTFRREFYGNSSLINTAEENHVEAATRLWFRLLRDARRHLGNDE